MSPEEKQSSYASRPAFALRDSIESAQDRLEATETSASWDVSEKWLNTWNQELFQVASTRTAAQRHIEATMNLLSQTRMIYQSLQQLA